jgi:hypothetical protein
MSTPNLRAEQIFAAALEMADPAERLAHVERACAGPAPTISSPCFTGPDIPYHTASVTKVSRVSMTT